MVKLTTDSGEVTRKIKNLPASETPLEDRKSSYKSISHDSLMLNPAQPNLSQTDQSDTTESDQDSGVVYTCSGAHDGRLLMQMELPFNVDHVFTMIFTDSEFARYFHEIRKNTDITPAMWEVDQASNQKVRKFSLVVPINQAVGPKSAQITEKQVLSNCSKPGCMYVIDTESLNAGIPYADSFYISSHFCIIRSPDSSKESTISVYCQVKYKKSVWGLVKTFIEKSCWSGLEEYYAALVKALQTECDKKRTGGNSRLLSKRKVSCRQRQFNSHKLVRPHVKISSDSSPAPSLPTPSSDDSPSIAVPVVAPSVHNPQYPRATPNLFSWTILTTLILHLIVSGFLYYKLWSLEEFDFKQKDLTPTDYYVLRELPPRSQDEWLDILQNQERLHKSDIVRWNHLIKETINSLRKAEDSLHELDNDVQNIVNKNIITVLKDALDKETHSSSRSSSNKEDHRNIKSPIVHSEEL